MNIHLAKNRKGTNGGATSPTTKASEKGKNRGRTGKWATPGSQEVSELYLGTLDYNQQLDGGSPSVRLPDRFVQLRLLCSWDDEMYLVGVKRNAEGSVLDLRCTYD